MNVTPICGSDVENSLPTPTNVAASTSDTVGNATMTHDPDLGNETVNVSLPTVSSQRRRRSRARFPLLRQPSELTDEGLVTADGVESVMETEATKREAQRLVYLKLLVLLILVLSATIFSVITFRYVTYNEEKQFATKFHNDANKVLESIGSSLDRTLGTMNAIAVTLVSHAHDNGDKWPFVSLPEFALHASKLIPLTDGLYVSILPIVTPSNKNKWEQYAYKQDFWVNESLAIQEVWNGYHGHITYDWNRSDFIYGDFQAIPDNVSRYMLPQWQSFPVAPEEGYTVYNWDWNSESNPASVQTSIAKQVSVLSETYMISLENDPEVNAELTEWARINSAYLPPGENSFEPVMDVNYPIINDITPTAVLETSNTTTGSNGIVVVVRNLCNEPFTYQINGPTVTYMGVGDRHSINYDGQETMSRLVDLKWLAQRDSVYSGAPIDVEFCPYTLHVYPSDTLKADYVTHDATFFLAAVLLIFVFTSSVFFLYDWYVEKRQYRIKSAAVRSSAIVSSLFPSTVRELLYQSAKKGTTDGPTTADNDDHSASPNDASPIAQIYADTTVLFADIVGFTSWCSSREPYQVFHLLETLYAGFDALAKVHGVFKIETIGDSYVAVVGLPKRRNRHAVVMAKFAHNMRTKMIELTAELGERLGPGTSDLALRIGLNSGPTTAGVLRGEKARFQLFGDTVNTAARMESNSAPFKIHVSESTADLLVAAGKGYWIESREEKINVKGKGLMQTYWCNPSVDVHSYYDSTSTQLVNI